MNETTRNNKKPKVNSKEPNKVSTPPIPALRTLAECYRDAWLTCLNKLTKHDQKQVLKEVAEVEEVGKLSRTVRNFINDVATMGELGFDKQSEKVK